jgi:hypothetical protein
VNHKFCFWEIRGTFFDLCCNHTGTREWFALWMHFDARFTIHFSSLDTSCPRAPKSLSKKHLNRSLIDISSPKSWRLKDFAASPAEISSKHQKISICSRILKTGCAAKSYDISDVFRIFANIIWAFPLSKTYTCRQLSESSNRPTSSRLARELSFNALSVFIILHIGIILTFTRPSAPLPEPSRWQPTEVRLLITRSNFWNNGSDKSRRSRKWSELEGRNTPTMVGKG